jgi:hypothetical protein
MLAVLSWSDDVSGHYYVVNEHGPHMAGSDSKTVNSKTHLDSRDNKDVSSNKCKEYH